MALLLDKRDVESGTMTWKGKHEKFRSSWECPRWRQGPKAQARAFHALWRVIQIT